MRKHMEHGHRFSARYTRRQFFQLAAAAPFAVTHGREARVASPLAFAPAAFDATDDSVLIWLHGNGRARVRVEFGNDPAKLAAGPTVDLTKDADYCSIIPLTQLAPGQTWTYRIVDAQSGKSLAGPGRFKTAPAEARPFIFAFSADMEESHQPFKLFDIMAAKQPDFFLHLGDTVYADQPKWQFSPSIFHYRRKHAANRKDRHLQNFLARHVTYAIWDDHETQNNCDSVNPHMADALTVFKEYWPCKAANPAALYRQFNWGGVDFFMLDTRRFRSPQTLSEGPDRTMLGSAQKGWFKERLKASTAPFKFIVTSVPFHGSGVDTWEGFASERAEITRFIRDERISGVIFLTGDYHLARDWSNTATGLREYMAGPIGAVTHYQRAPSAREWYAKTGAFHYGDGCNFGLWRVDPVAAKARLEFIDASGKTLFRTELSA